MARLPHVLLAAVAAVAAPSALAAQLALPRDLAAVATPARRQAPEPVASLALVPRPAGAVRLLRSDTLTVPRPAPGPGTPRTEAAVRRSALRGAVIGATVGAVALGAVTVAMRERGWSVGDAIRSGDVWPSAAVGAGSGALLGLAVGYLVARY